MSEIDYKSIFPEKGAARVLKHLVFWFAILAFFSLFDLAISNGTIWDSIKGKYYLPASGYFTGIPYTVPYYPKALFKKRYLLFLVTLAAVFVINIVLSFLVDYLIVPALGIEMEEMVLAKRLLSSIMSFTFIAGIASILKLIEINSQTQLNKESAEAKYHKAELALLRSQINPHFLFNVFNNIDELIYKDKEKASEILAFLSDSLRYVLQGSDSEFVPLEDELRFIRSYLKVASISFSDPDFISLKIGDGCTTPPIAPMIFIPFVENCVKHCNKRVGSPGIEIEIECDSRSVRLHCVNSVKRDRDNPEQSGGFGLINAGKRLGLIYPERYKLEAGIKEGKYVADLIIKWQ